MQIGIGLGLTVPRGGVRRRVLAIIVDVAGNVLVDSEGRALVGWVNQSEAS